jgi:hypothetical protein
MRDSAHRVYADKRHVSDVLTGEQGRPLSKATNFEAV